MAPRIPIGTFFETDLFYVYFQHLLLQSTNSTINALTTVKILQRIPVYDSNELRPATLLIEASVPKQKMWRRYIPCAHRKAPWVDRTIREKSTFPYPTITESSLAILCGLYVPYRFFKRKLLNQNPLNNPLFSQWGTGNNPLPTQPIQINRFIPAKHNTFCNRPPTTRRVHKAMARETCQYMEVI